MEIIICRTIVVGSPEWSLQTIFPTSEIWSSPYPLRLAGSAGTPYGAVSRGSGCCFLADMSKNVKKGVAERLELFGNS